MNWIIKYDKINSNQVFKSMCTVLQTDDAVTSLLSLRGKTWQYEEILMISIFALNWYFHTFREEGSTKNSKFSFAQFELFLDAVAYLGLRVLSQKELFLQIWAISRAHYIEVWFNLLSSSLSTLIFCSLDKDWH